MLDTVLDLENSGQPKAALMEVPFFHMAAVKTH